MLPRNYPSYERCCIGNTVVLVVSGRLFHEGYHEDVFLGRYPCEICLEEVYKDGKILATTAKWATIRIDRNKLKETQKSHTQNQKSKGNQNKIVTLCRKKREMQQT
jgi:hypothetical protein